MIDELVKLLALSNVKKVIYVDDIFNVENFKDQAIAVLMKWLETGEYKKLEFLSQDKDIAKEEFESWWLSADIDDKRKCVFDKMQITNQEQNIMTCLEDINKRGVDVEFLPPDLFTDNYIAQLKLKVNDDAQVLLLVDRELGVHKHGGDALLRKVDNIQFVHCGLFSGTFGIEDEIETWKTSGYSAKVYPLSKKRIIEGDQDRIVEGLRNILWLNHISKIKKDALDLFKKGCKKACEKLNSMDPASFDSAIIKASYNEGCWEYVTLNRILMLMLVSSIQSEFVDNTHFKRIQADFCQLRESSKLSSENKIDKSYLKYLRNSELYTLEYINQTYSPIANGDLFEIGKKRYILLFQPCSLVIRNNGHRSRDLSSAYVVEVKQHKSKEQLRDNEVSLESQKQQEYSYVNLADFKRVNLDVMDMVSFNSDGKALIDVANDTPIEEQGLIQPNMLKRYSKIVKFAKKLMSLLKENSNPKIKPDIDYFLKSCFIIVPSVKENTIIEFDIKRVGRYNELLSQVLYSKLMNYMARLAVPNDFSE